MFLVICISAVCGMLNFLSAARVAESAKPNVITLDERVQRLVQYLQESGLRERTIIVYQSDNGHSVEARAHFGGGNNSPYGGAKSSVSEGGIRLPALISWPIWMKMRANERIWLHATRR